MWCLRGIRAHRFSDGRPAADGLLPPDLGVSAACCFDVTFALLPRIATVLVPATTVMRVAAGGLWTPPLRSWLTPLIGNATAAGTVVRATEGLHGGVTANRPLPCALRVLLLGLARKDRAGRTFGVAMRMRLMVRLLPPQMVADSGRCTFLAPAGLAASVAVVR